MKYIQCKSCHHFNPIKSEYQIFCDACGKKNNDNFKSWSQKHPNKTFEDYKMMMGVEKTQAKKNKKKLTPKMFLQRFTLGLMFFALFFFGYKYSSKLYLFFHDYAFPVSELLGEEWKRQYFAEKKVSFESPYLLKEFNIDEQLPEQVKNVVVNMENYLYKDNPIFSISFTAVSYDESIGMVNLQNASNGSVNEVLSKMNGTNLYTSDTDTYINQYPALIKKGNFTSDGNNIYFKSITCVKNNLTAIHLLTLWVGEDENYKLLSDRIINSIDVR